MAGTKLKREINLMAPKSIKIVNPLNLIHCRCGHAGITTILAGIKYGHFKDSAKYAHLLKNGNNFDFCKVCATAKLKAKRRTFLLKVSILRMLRARIFQSTCVGQCLSNHLVANVFLWFLLTDAPGAAS